MNDEANTFETCIFLPPEEAKVKFTIKKGNSKRYFFSGFVTCSIVWFCISTLTIGILLYLYTTSTGACNSKTDNHDHVIINGHNYSIEDAVNMLVSNSSLLSYHYDLTILPHLAGSDQNNQLASSVLSIFKQYLDYATLIPYMVLLSYPSTISPSYLRIANTTGIVYAANTLTEPHLEVSENAPGLLPPFNGYSGNGTLNSSLIYVNYGRIEEFKWLSTNNISVSGSICIIRYGHLFRGDKVQIAQEHGCTGVILFSDPLDYAPKKGPQLFPKGISLPASGLQRGTLMKLDGDPLTPGLPSIPGIYRQDYENQLKAKNVPRIPVQPISWTDASQFLMRMGGAEAPKEWQGQANFTYHLGPGFVDTSETVEFSVTNNLEVKTINNVIGKLYGDSDIDRQIMIGNHRDAWVFGGADPSSGTAGLLMIAEALGQMRASGWRPRRTILLCSWDAEEYGLIGSTEFVEEHGKYLQKETLAYLNVDISVHGKFVFDAAASPLLYTTLYQATNNVPCPSPNFSTVFAEWAAKESDNNQPNLPFIRNLGSGSDFSTIFQVLGISSADLTYRSRNYGYPTYHSIHDTHYYVSQLLDPGFVYHAALTRVWLQATLILANHLLIPVNLTQYPEQLSWGVRDLENNFGSMSSNISNLLNPIKAEIASFTEICQKYEQLIKLCQKAATSERCQKFIKILNDVSLMLERVFLWADGLPDKFFKHVVYAPSLHNSYASSMFPGITDSLSEEKINWNKTLRQISIVHAGIHQATVSLNHSYYELQFVTRD